MVVMLPDRRKPGLLALGSLHPARFLFPTLGRRHHLVGAVLVCRMVQKGTDVVDEQRVEELCNLLLVRKI